MQTNYKFKEPLIQQSIRRNLVSALENCDLIPIGGKGEFTIGSKRTNLLRQLRTFIEFKHKLCSIIPKI